MYVEPHDWRPPTLLRLPPPRPEQIAGGVAILLGVNVLLPLVLLVAGAVFSVLSALTPDEPPIREREVVEAKLVQLGKEPDPDKLPDRQVPVKPTAPPPEALPTKNRTEPEEEPPEKEPPPEAETDDEPNFLDRAEAFAERAKMREKEGSPDGFEEGTAKQATEGNRYFGMLSVFFQRNWGVPSTVPESTVRTLSAEVNVRIGENLQVVDFSMVRQSGNATFDSSVLGRLEALKKSGATVPEPPPEVSDRIRGQTIGVRFNGKNANTGS